MKKIAFILATIVMAQNMHAQSAPHVKDLPSPKQLVALFPNDGSSDSYTNKIAAINTALDFIRKLAGKREFTNEYTQGEIKLRQQYYDAKTELNNNHKKLSETEEKEINRQIYLKSSSREMKNIVGTLLPQYLKEQLKITNGASSQNTQTAKLPEKTYPTIQGWWHVPTSEIDILELYLGENGIGKYDGDDMNYQLSKNMLRIETDWGVHVFIVEFQNDVLKLSTGNNNNLATWEYKKGRNMMSASKKILPRTKNSKLTGRWYFKDHSLLRLVFEDNGRVVFEDKGGDLKHYGVNSFPAFTKALYDPFWEDGKTLKVSNNGKYTYSITNDSVLTIKHIGKEYIFLRARKISLGNHPKEVIGLWYFPFQEDPKFPKHLPEKYEYDQFYDFMSNGRLLSYQTRKMDGEIVSSEKGWWGTKAGNLSILLEEVLDIPGNSTYTLTGNQLKLTTKYDGFASSLIGNMVKKHGDVKENKAAPANTIASGRSMITEAELCEYFPLKKEMVYTYKESGQSLTIGLLNLLSDGRISGTEETILKEEYDFKNSKIAKGKNFKGYLLNSTDKNRSGKQFYYSCENGSVVSHTERYEVVSEDEGMVYDWPDNMYKRQYSLSEKATGQFVNWTLLKANTKVGQEWVEEQITGSSIMVTKSVIEEIGTTVTVNGIQYKDVIKVKREFSTKGTDAFGEQEIYYAKGVGVIKRVDYSTASTEIITELVSYSLK